MSQVTSPRLPGVPILQPDATGPIYSRWRRSIKFALETRGVWKYCNGKCPMPMPDAGLNGKPTTASTTKLQPSLLEERRAWARQDREVKLDIFLSLADEVMQEVFEVGPPIPPSSLNAREMLKALDAHFVQFKFEPYHHAFCHFLNLHIDQYATIEDFNKEFSATLEDLLDHGLPLSNTQACSAYFSKLRCTQNLWVAKKLEEWDSLSSEPELHDLMREAPPLSFIRPLATKSSQSLKVDSIPEESLEDSSTHSDSDFAPDPSNASTVSSKTSHSRHTSYATIHSQEITVHASSEDITEIDPEVFRRELQKLTPSALQERVNSTDSLPKPLTLENPTEPSYSVPEWLSMRKSIAYMPFPAPIDRPLPPLPGSASRSSSTSPKIQPTIPNNKSETNLIDFSVNVSSSHLSALRLETTHPTLRPQTPTPPLTEHPAFRVHAPSSQEPTAIHPALRPREPTPQPSAEPQLMEVHPALRIRTPTPTPTQTPTPLAAPATKVRPSSPPLKLPEFISSSPNLAIPWPSTPDVPQRPHSSRAALPFSQVLQPDSEEAKPHDDDISPDLTPVQHTSLRRVDSTNSSVISLPLQGTRDSAWDYLYEKSSSGVGAPPRDHSVSPIEPLGTNITALPQVKGTLSRAPTFDDFVLTPPTEDVGRPKGKDVKSHVKSSSADIAGRLSGDSLLESSEEVREREKEAAKKHRKKKSWVVNVNLARFSASRGVKEII